MRRDVMGVHAGSPGHDITSHSGGDEAAGKILTGRTVLWWLLTFFVVVIGSNAVMIALAIGTMPGLETEKPYQTGISYNAEIETARVQAARHWTVVSHIDRDASGRAA